MDKIGSLACGNVNTVSHLGRIMGKNWHSLKILYRDGHKLEQIVAYDGSWLTNDRPWITMNQMENWTSFKFPILIQKMEFRKPKWILRSYKSIWCGGRNSVCIPHTVLCRQLRSEKGIKSQEDWDPLNLSLLIFSSDVYWNAVLKRETYLNCHEIRNSGLCNSKFK